MDKKERQLYLATVPSSAFESGNLKRYYGCLTCYPFISDKLNHPSFDVQDVINDYDYIYQSDLRNHPDYDAERTEALKLIQETFRLSAHILREHPEQLISQLLGRLFYPSLLENSYIQSFLEQAKAKIVPPALIPYLGSLQPPGTGLIRTLAGHNGFVNAVAITPDGTKIVSGGSIDGTIKIWDLAKGQELLSFRVTEFDASVSSLAIFPDGMKIIAGGHFLLKIWNLITGDELYNLVSNTFPGAYLVIITPDGSKIINSTDYDGTIRVWSVLTEQELFNFQLFNFQSYQHRINSLKITSDSSKIIAGSSNGTIVVKDLVKLSRFPFKILFLLTKKFKQLREVFSLITLNTIFGHKSSVNTLVITPDDSKFISGSSDSTIKIWDLATGKELQTLTGHSKGVNTLAITPDGSKLVSGSCDSTIKIWDLTREKLSFFPTNHNSDVSKLLVMSNNRRLVSASYDSTIKVWDFLKGQEIETLTGHGKEIKNAVVSSDDLLAISSSEDQTIKVWDIVKGNELFTFSNDSVVEKVIYNNQIILGGSAGNIIIVDLIKNKPFTLLNGFCHYFKHSEIVITRDRKYSLFQDREGLKMWSLARGKELGKVATYWGTMVTMLTISSDNSRIIIGYNNGTLQISQFCLRWRLHFKADQQKASIIEYAHKDRITSIAITPDNCYIISGSLDKLIKVWHLDMGECLYTFINDTPITAIVISPDGKKVIAGDEAGRLHFLELIV
ncbi:MAG: WD40 repeat domain-containing protein [Microcystis aeruginosa K13-05]|jgi:WD40 repeat protein|uniref:WD40 repeat domain-containing protein n=1 Tax=unclassified Microcystis TaxID=2643300 RepID=UPI0022BFAFCD|nr:MULTISPECIES: WD40 repeat domain-containing protein [unclassified Microcystis]MCZ8048007.1 WD40 repeat domain-containing protein [Microcystis sp. LE19-41.2A]MCZ8288217.1 WD40 repeat domain-containing protein [Microcystis sp. LE19-59.1C]NCR86112.1 WD40 repeat domain-containing protein [Microcystis aeruginosa K13-05]